MKEDRTQQERLDYLVKWLCKESGRTIIPKENQEKRRLMRSLMNIRMPQAIDGEFLQIQDQFLQQEADEKGIVLVEQLQTVRETFASELSNSDRMVLWQGDITTLAADAIVNAANSQMLGCFVPCHGCIDNAIHSAAGIQLREACWRIMVKQGHEEPTGQAKITEAYNLPCKYVLHTVGPIIGEAVTEQDCELLASCYRSCLTLAWEKGLKSIAFCCISTGEFHFPQEAAAEIAVNTVGRFLEEHIGLEKVIFNVYQDQDRRIYEKIFLQ